MFYKLVEHEREIEEMWLLIVKLKKKHLNNLSFPFIVRMEIGSLAANH